MNKVLVSLSLCVVGLAFGQGRMSYSLTEARDAALKNSEKLKNAAYDEELARLKVIETRAIGLPQANISGNFTNFLNLPVQVVGASFINPNAGPDETISFRAGTDYTATGTLQVSQLLFNGSYLVGLQVSRFYREFTATATEKTQEEVFYGVTQAYHLAVVTKANIGFMDSIVQITQQLVDKQRNYLELGLMVQEDFDQLTFALTSARNSQANARLQYDNALALLKMTMGLEQTADVEPSEGIEAMLQQNLSLGDESASVSSNIAYVMLAKQVTLNEFNLRNKKALNLPTASAFFQQTYNAFRNEFNFFADKPWYPQTLWGLQVQIPIFTSGSHYAQIRQAQVELEKSRTQLSELNKALEMQRVQLNNNFQFSRNQLDLQKQNVELARGIYQNALVKAEIGKDNSILVTQKYNQLVMAQAQYIGAMLEVFNTRSSLDRLYHKMK